MYQQSHSRWGPYEAILPRHTDPCIFVDSRLRLRQYETETSDNFHQSDADTQSHAITNAHADTYTKSFHSARQLLRQPPFRCGAQ